MLQASKKLALIKLTPEQIESIKRQTGVNYVPDSISFAIDTFVEKRQVDFSPGEAPAPTTGLIHELNRI